MSWIDDVVDYGKDLIGKLGALGGDTNFLTTILTTIATGWGLYELTKSINKDNKAADPVESPPKPDFGVRLQVDADTASKIPVVYGQAIVGGKLIDAVMTNDNQTMWYAMVLSEVTGPVDLGAGGDSQINFLKVYWNGQLMSFATDGITAAYSTDKTGAVDTSIAGLVKVYCFNNGSANPVWITGQTSGATMPAYTYFPNWDSTWTLDELAFVLVRVDYSREKNVSGIGQMQFLIQNTMDEPGDCLYDYMTNTRYGAGIPAAQIKVLS